VEAVIIIGLRCEMLPSMVLVPYVFTASEFFAWKQEIPNLSSKSGSRCSKMGAGSEHSVRGGEGPLPEARLLNWMRKFDWTFVDFSIPRMTRVMYEETKAAIVFGFGALMLEFWAFPQLRNYLVTGAPWLLSVPLSFLLLLCLIRPFEARMFNIFVPSEALARKGSSSTGSSTRSHRIFQNLILLGFLLGTHAASHAAFSEINNRQIESDLWRSFEWGPYQYLLFILRLAKKMHGACAMVITYRIYIDTALHTSHHITGYPSGNKGTSPEAEEEKMKLVQAQKSRSRRNADNGRNANQPGSETDPISD